MGGKVSDVGLRLSAVRLPLDTVILSPIPKGKGVQAPSAPGFMVPSGLRLWALQFPPTERAGSEEVIYAAEGGYKLRPQGATTTL